MEQMNKRMFREKRDAKQSIRPIFCHRQPLGQAGRQHLKSQSKLLILNLPMSHSPSQGRSIQNNALTPTALLSRGAHPMMCVVFQSPETSAERGQIYVLQKITLLSSAVNSLQPSRAVP